MNISAMYLGVGYFNRVKILAIIWITISVLIWTLKFILDTLYMMISKMLLVGMQGRIILSIRQCRHVPQAPSTIGPPSIEKRIFAI